MISPRAGSDMHDGHERINGYETSTNPSCRIQRCGRCCAGAIAKWHDKRQGKACMQVRNTLSQTYSMSGIESSVDWSGIVERLASN